MDKNKETTDEKDMLNEEIKTEETLAPEAEINSNNDALETKDKLLRTLAEFENYKKRSQKEKEALYEFTICEVVSKIIPVYDTLSLSLNHETEDEALKTGVELTLKQFKEVLKKLNVCEIEAIGSTFDPNFHNAVMHIEDEQYKEKEIIEVLQTGYKLGDKVIRYSMVKVAN